MPFHAVIFSILSGNFPQHNVPPLLQLVQLQNLLPSVHEEVFLLIQLLPLIFLNTEYSDNHHRQKTVTQLRNQVSNYNCQM